ncbi:hypothetical protein BJI69_17580 [Luteibacter rhizovicinus DSM 16549]|uniref:Lipocalin-like domain-containing protein n=1 Tax=Luteibacter rhizovicinus DSM 16549 TaxID=1440763 RepID=A0A1L3EWX5_9GAMM|nr:hypothetical protein [Luteibacter rhizovicinus]APG05532.1 hypothetical protein BJI69_17580 [Luteibacter rhizovicinus DSM 16549]
MNAKLRMLPAALTLIGLCALACTSAVTAHDSDDRGDSSDLSGTWQFQITLRNCQSGAPIGAPFQSLLTFADGGTMTETTANSMFYPAERGPGHGVWSRGKHKGEYTAASMAFITMNGALVKSQKISQTITMGPGQDKLAVPKATVEFFDPVGNLLQTACAVAVAERFEP